MTQRLIAFLPFVASVPDSAMTFLREVGARGYAVNPILCDGVFSACDVHLRREQRPANTCLLCQASAAGRMAQWKMPYRWLGRWHAPEDTQTAGAWVASLKPQDYPNAADNRWPLGEWIADSVQRHLGAEPNLADPSAAMIFASHLFSARLAADALNRMYGDTRADAIFVAESRSALARTALGVAKDHALPVLLPES